MSTSCWECSVGCELSGKLVGQHAVLLLNRRNACSHALRLMLPNLRMVLRYVRFHFGMDRICATFLFHDDLHS